MEETLRKQKRALEKGRETKKEEEKLVVAMQLLTFGRRRELEGEGKS